MHEIFCPRGTVMPNAAIECNVVWGTMFLILCSQTKDTATWFLTARTRNKNEEKNDEDSKVLGSEFYEDQL